MQQIVSTDGFKTGLSVPNWYWRTWEVLFGVVAACIPTLRPLYKWLLQEYTRFTHHGREPKAKSDHRAIPEKHLAASTKKHGTDREPGSTQETDFLPIQGIRRGDGGPNVEQEILPRFEPGLRLHGDLATDRPGNIKRWDSEAQVGGGHAIREVEDRI